MGAGEAHQPGLLLTAAPVACRRNQTGAPTRVTGPGRPALAGLGEPFLRILPDGFEESVRSRTTEAGLCHDHRLIHQPSQ